jgi:lipoate-protein ligase A
MRWRLIRSEPASGAWNMAVDEAMLLAHAAGLTPPTLRLYAWSPPALSLGLLQPLNAEWAKGCARLGFDLVRRPSGGGAVLHQHEVTYAIVTDGRSCPQGSSVLATYRWLEGGLRAALHLLGIEPDAPFQPDHPVPSASFCYARLTGADLSVRGRKLCGSAQARRRNFLLQHGSLPLRWDVIALRHLFGDEATPLTCLEWLTGKSLTPETVMDALGRGFAWALGVTFVESDLTPTEKAIADLLCDAKYGSAAWTRERQVAPELRLQVERLLQSA